MRQNIDRRALGVGLLGLSLTGAVQAAPAASSKGARQGPFLIGADVTWAPQDEADGATYFAHGRQQDILAILGQAGFNAVKLRVFVNPENGYSRQRPVAPWGGLEQTVRMARRVKAAGLHLTISFHYSDDWADPQKQAKPAAWAALPFPALTEAVRTHTRSVLTALNKAGAPADMVIVGNEITFGLLWPTAASPPPRPPATRPPTLSTSAFPTPVAGTRWRPS